mgnify:CR=1 FL=1
MSEKRDDLRGHSVFRAWGCRRVGSDRPASSQSSRLGQVNPRSIQSFPRLPATCLTVDPIVRGPQRFAGGHTFLGAYHQQYQYYRRFGNAGQNAATSAHHNFPSGDLPAPQNLYGTTIGLTRCTKCQRSPTFSDSSTSTR